MRFNIYKEARISLYILAALLSFFVLFYFFSSMFTSMGYKGFRNARDANVDVESNSIKIIIDAGHGGEDPGATDNNLIEKDLNLSVALSLEELLASCGFETVLTRSEDVLLYNEGQESRKKYYDLRNREEIAEKYTDAIFVSIHMNKFSAEYCKGLQAFYSDNNSQSKILAEFIQNNAKILQKDNKRIIKSGNDTIYLLENLEMPAVLIECGFISNREEALLLADEEYRLALALSIYCGIVEYTENYE